MRGDVVDYKRMYQREVKRNEQLRKVVDKQREEIDNYFNYIQKQTIVIQLLKDRIKELKGLKWKI